MAGIRRTKARIAGEAMAAEAARAAGAAVRASRKRRHLAQEVLARNVGVSRSRLADIETGDGAGLPLDTWFALGEALGRPFKAEFVRDRLEQPADAGHLDIQELVLGLGRHVGYDRIFELATRPADPTRSSDAALLDRRQRRLILNECWNTFGNIGESARSSDRKMAEAAQLAIAMAGDGPPYQLGLCWIVRDTARNRELIARYRHIFEARFPGSSTAWVRALTEGGPIPAQPGMVWCDLRATRLFAWRRQRAG